MKKLISFSRIAKGEEPGQPEASNMMEMVWDEEMEEIAQRWTHQCDQYQYRYQ